MGYAVITVVKPDGYRKIWSPELTNMVENSVIHSSFYDMYTAVFPDEKQANEYYERITAPFTPRTITELEILKAAYCRLDEKYWKECAAAEMGSPIGKNRSEKLKPQIDEIRTRIIELESRV